MDSDEKRLRTGFDKFRTEVYDKKPDLFERLKTKQKPRYLVFACADSRVCPSVTLGLELGEAFIVRNIGAMVPFYCENKHTGIGSAIEYAICVLEVKVIVVIGHSRCGGIKTLLSLKDGADDCFKFVEDWVRIGLSAKRKVEDEYSGKPPEQQCAFLEKAVVDVSLDNLRTYPFVKDGVDNGTVKLVGGHYDFVSGKFDTWKAKNQTSSHRSSL
ncbi:carbonic anhydrase, chloroplastic-like [Triticum urartu]|nr:carbonic anhydrase, chloroplastic-like [Triticum urartu]